VTWYGESKALAEAAVLERAAVLPVTIIRPPGVYGPRDHAWLTLFQAAARGWALLAGRPDKRYSLIHAQDLAAALVVGARGVRPGGTYFACHPEIVTLTGIVEAAERAVERPTRRLALPESAMHLIGRLVDLGSQWTGRSSVLGAQRMREVATGDWTCAPGALERDGGWVARIGLCEGFQETVAWYREQGLLPSSPS
jgi:nucleoside-diphosphate-sugar epimerase